MPRAVARLAARCSRQATRRHLARSRTCGSPVRDRRAARLARVRAGAAQPGLAAGCRRSAFLALLVVACARARTRTSARCARGATTSAALSRLDGTWAGTGPDGARFLGDHPLRARSGSVRARVALPADRHGADRGGRGDAGRLAACAGATRARCSSGRPRSPSCAIASTSARRSRCSPPKRTCRGPARSRAWAARGAGRSRAGARCAVRRVRGCHDRAASAAMFAGWISSVPVAGLARWFRPAIALVCIAPRVWQVIRRVDAAADDLSLLEALLARLERRPFHAARLGALRGALDGRAEAVSADRAAAPLHCGARRAAQRVRPSVRAAAARRSQAAVAIDRWHAAHRAALAAWIAAIGEFEALSSLATYAFEHPRDPFPELVEARSRVRRGRDWRIR